ncbi:MAG TPA: phosphoglycerate mutase family protein [Urbifossiella sp.]|jgi:phosphohistidine phosphatase SixA
MNLLIIRHADAGDRNQWSGDDDERPLSLLGHKQAHALGDALKQRGLELQAVISSPLVRTRETAEGILASVAAPPAVIFSDLLAPGALRRRKLAKYLATVGVDSLAIVGHDPDLPAFLGWLLGVDPEHVPLEKGGAASLHFEEEPGKGDGTLGWVITPQWYLNGS